MTPKSLYLQKAHPSTGPRQHIKAAGLELSAHLQAAQEPLSPSCREGSRGKGNANQCLPSTQTIVLLLTGMALKNVLKPQNLFLGRPVCTALTFKKIPPMASQRSPWKEKDILHAHTYISRAFQMVPSFTLRSWAVCVQHPVVASSNSYILCYAQGGEQADQHNPEVSHPGLKATACLPHGVKVKRLFPLSAPPSPSLSAPFTRASRVPGEVEAYHFPFCFCSDHSLGYPLFYGPRDVWCVW